MTETIDPESPLHHATLMDLSRHTSSCRSDDDDVQGSTDGADLQYVWETKYLEFYVCLTRNMLPDHPATQELFNLIYLHLRYLSVANQMLVLRLIQLLTFVKTESVINDRVGTPYINLLFHTLRVFLVAKHGVIQNMIAALLYVSTLTNPTNERGKLHPLIDGWLTQQFNVGNPVRRILSQLHDPLFQGKYMPCHVHLVRMASCIATLQYLPHINILSGAKLEYVYYAQSLLKSSTDIAHRLKQVFWPFYSQLSSILQYTSRRLEGQKSHKTHPNHQNHLYRSVESRMDTKSQSETSHTSNNDSDLDDNIVDPVPPMNQTNFPPLLTTTKSEPSSETTTTLDLTLTLTLDPSRKGPSDVQLVYISMDELRELLPFMVPPQSTTDN